MRIAHAIGLTTALAMSSPGAAAWQQASSPHFVVYADDKPATVQAFATMLERADKAMRVLRGIADPPVSPMARVRVYVVSNLNAVARVYGDGGEMVAGFYMPRASTSVAFVPRDLDRFDEAMAKLNPREILLHEYAHHFMYSSYPGRITPAWLSEGFAEFHATMRFEKDGSVLVGGVPRYRLDALVGSGVGLPVATLLTVNPATLDGSGIQTFYGRSWLLTHYLTIASDRREQLTAYLRALGRGEEPAAAAKVFGDLGKLDAKLDRYVMSPLGGFRLDPDEVRVPAVSVRALTPAEAATMPLRIATDRGVDDKQARSVAAQARAMAATYPADPRVLEELAEAEYDAANWAAAQAAAERALAADPASVAAMLYQGLARMASARADKSTDPARWEAARGWLRKANRADPEYAWPLQLYYQSFIEAGVAPNRNAQDGLLYAYRLAPFDQALGLAAALVQLQRGDRVAATAALQPIAFHPHGRDEAARARAVLTMIERNNLRRAIATLSAAADDAQAD